MQHKAALFVLHCNRSFLMNVLMYCGTGWGTAQRGLGRKFTERRIPDEAGFLFLQFFFMIFTSWSARPQPNTSFIDNFQDLVVLPCTLFVAHPCIHANGSLLDSM